MQNIICPKHLCTVDIDTDTTILNPKYIILEYTKFCSIFDSLTMDPHNLKTSTK